jgi:hypothetical protein
MYIANELGGLIGKSFGSLTGVDFARSVTGAPTSSVWHAGQSVLRSGLPIAKGTLIATFEGGHFPTPRGRAALVVDVDLHGSAIKVLENRQGGPLTYSTIYPHAEHLEFFVVE